MSELFNKLYRQALDRDHERLILGLRLLESFGAEQSVCWSDWWRLADEIIEESERVHNRLDNLAARWRAVRPSVKLTEALSTPACPLCRSPGCFCAQSGAQPLLLHIITEVRRVEREAAQ